MNWLYNSEKQQQCYHNWYYDKVYLLSLFWVQNKRTKGAAEEVKYLLLEYLLYGVSNLPYFQVLELYPCFLLIYQNQNKSLFWSNRTTTAKTCIIFSHNNKFFLFDLMVNRVQRYHSFLDVLFNRALLLLLLLKFFFKYNRTAVFTISLHRNKKRITWGRYSQEEYAIRQANVDRCFTAITQWKSPTRHFVSRNRLTLSLSLRQTHVSLNIWITPARQHK